MVKCDPKAFAKCPTRHLCGTPADATFAPGSECDKFNQHVLLQPMTNADRIRAMSDEELAEWFSALAYGRDTPWSDQFKRKYCDNCPSEMYKIKETGQVLRLYECDFADGKCPHGSDIVWWLKQPAGEE